MATIISFRREYLPKEIKLLLLCARTRHSHEILASIHDLIAQHPDWNAVITLAERHGVLPLLYFSLNKLPCIDIPSYVIDRLRTRVHEISQKNMLIVKEMLSLSDEFNRSNIRVAFFKGPVLALQAYNNLSKRQFSDLDILIDKQDFPAAKALLETSGYRTLTTQLKGTEKNHIRRNHDYPFIHQGHSHVIELQWGVMQEPIVFPPDIGGLWQRMDIFTIGVRQVLTLADSDLLLVLCLHGAKHLWFRLKWICDLAEFVQSQPNLDWNAVFERARILGCMRALLLGMQLAHDMVDMPLPSIIAQALRRDPVVRGLQEDVYRWLFVKDPLDTERPIFFYRLMERLQERLRISLTYAPTLLRPVRFLRIYGLRTVRYVLGPILFK